MKAPQKFPRKVTVFEVGPRDGLQNESRRLSLAAKLDFIQGLRQAGLKQIEAGAFVRLDRVPQMADTDAVFRSLPKGPSYWALVPNPEGLARAIRAGAKNIAVFTAASESFNKSNIGMTIAESLSRIREVIGEARRHKLAIRGYVSTVFGCPFEGKVHPKRAISVAERLLELGVEQVSLGDTIGVATPLDVDKVVGPFLQNAGVGATAVHFHDTRGTALANAYRALEWGVATIDASAGGLGGCPFAPGATGNLATEDLVYLLNGLKIESGVDLEALCRTSLALGKVMDRPIASRYLSAYWAACSGPVPAKRSRP